MKASELQAGPELDVLIAEKAMGWRKQEDYRPGCPGIYWLKPTGGAEEYWTRERFKPSTDERAALEVVRRMREEWFSFKAWEPALVGPPEIYSTVSFVCGAGPCPKHGTTIHNHHGSYRVQAPTLALAICRSALVALNVVEEDPEF